MKNIFTALFLLTAPIFGASGYFYDAQGSINGHWTTTQNTGFLTVTITAPQKFQTIAITDKTGAMQYWDFSPASGFGGVDDSQKPVFKFKGGNEYFCDFNIGGTREIFKDFGLKIRSNGVFYKASAVPEPAGIALLAISCAPFILRKRRNEKKKQQHRTK